jgi:hypothetical protein
MLEGLEERWVPSQAAGGLPIVPDSSPPTGDFFHNYQQFNYTTPSGTHVEIKIVGRGSLLGTKVDSSGALHLLFSKTNAYTKITSNVHGGTGQVDWKTPGSPIARSCSCRPIMAAYRTP